MVYKQKNDEAIMLQQYENSNLQKKLDTEKAIFPISVIAEILNVHQRTLRIYDEENLLSPNRSTKNRRLYSISEIERGKFIQYLTRNLGINLIGIKVILNLLLQLKVPQEKHIEYINNIAGALNITPEVQEENRIKLSKRGRRSNKQMIDC